MDDRASTVGHPQVADREGAIADRPLPKLSSEPRGAVGGGPEYNESIPCKDEASMERIPLSGLSLIVLGLWVGVGFLFGRHSLPRREVRWWGWVTVLLMALSQVAGWVAVWWLDLPGGQVAQGLSEVFLNLGVLANAFWVVALLRSPSRRVVLGKLGLLALSLGGHLWAWPMVQAGVEWALWGVRWRWWWLGFHGLVLLILGVWAMHQRWQGLPRHRWRHLAFLVATLGWPALGYLLAWMLEPALPFPRHLWIGFPVGLAWLLGWISPIFFELISWPMERLLAEIGAGVLVFSWPQGQLLWWNRQIEEWFGDRQGRVLLPRQLEEQLSTLLQQPQAAEIHLDTLARRFELRGVPLDGVRGSLRALVLYDITESYQIQQALLQQNTLEERRQRLLQMALEASTWQELARNLVRYLVKPWPEFSPLGCALYLYDWDTDSRRARRVWSEPQDLPWAEVWENVPEATLAPLTRTPIVDPDALHHRARAVGLIPLVPATGEPPLGVLAFLLAEDAIALWDRWLTVRRELGMLIAFLLRFAQAQEYQVLLEIAFQHAITAMAIFNAQGRPLVWNQAMEAALRDQGFDSTLLLSPPDDVPMCDRWWRPGLWREITQTLATQDRWQGIFEQQTPQGVRYWRVVAFPVHVQDHQILEIGCVVHDFTDLERARRELEMQQHLLERLLQAARVLWQTLPSLNRLLSETLRLLKSWYPDAGVSIVLLEQAPGGRLYVTTWLRETGPQPIPPFFTRLLREGALGWVIRHQETLFIQDTTTDPRWYQLEDTAPAIRSVVMAPLLYRNRPLGTLTLSHPEPGRFTETERRLLSSIAQWLALALHNARLYEEQLRLQRRYRREQERLQQDQQAQVRHMGELSAALRTPLRAYLEALEQSRKRFEADVVLSRSLERMYHLVQDMLREIETYLDHRQLQELRFPSQPPPPLSVVTLFQELYEILQPLAERYQAQVEWEVHPKDLVVAHDRVRLRRVLQYLAEFCIRRAQSGRVVLRAFYDPESTPPGVIFWVMDTGVPLDPQLVDQLFQRAGDGASALFPLAYHARQMNLAVVQEYVQQLGGRLRVRTVSGFGLAFWLWIPQSAFASVGSPSSPAFS